MYASAVVPILVQFLRELTHHLLIVVIEDPLQVKLKEGFIYKILNFFFIEKAFCYCTNKDILAFDGVSYLTLIFFCTKLPPPTPYKPP